MIRYPEETLTVPLLSRSGLPPFYPASPETLEETRLSVVLVEDLILKSLLEKGSLSGRQLADGLCLPFKVMQAILAELKSKMLVVHRTTASLGDFIYVLTQQGKENAMLAKEYSAYSGPAPVVFEDYLESVSRQSLRHESPGIEDLKRAYADVILNEKVLNALGPAINSGRGIFLFGDPGNGKTTLAERISHCFKEDIYIPRALWIEGEIVQLYDPQNHQLITDDRADKRDARWLKIKRPTVVVGGELVMSSLEIHYNPTLKISEAPFQMKANGGIFLIDDFGRQRIDHRDLLNRWIVPLEKRYDFLLLPNGKKIQVPFDELIIFSTNLNPNDLVDDAFLRRIPYKIEVGNPSEPEFRQLFRYQCEKYRIPYEDAMIDYLIEHHYQHKRGFRVCHPRDILDQIVNMSTYLRIEPKMSASMLDLACQNYFSAMTC
jgi:predicted ATPase with chaperone activity